MKKNRTFAMALAFALSMSLLTSCGGGKEQTPAPEVQNPSQSETVAPEVNEPAQPESGENTEQEPAPEQKEELKLSHADVTFKAEGDSFTLGTNLSGEQLYFGSQDETIATVDEKGMVTAVAPGKTEILVETEDGRNAKCIVRCDWEVKTEETTQPEEKPVEKPAEQPEEKPAEKPAQTKVDLNAFVMELATKYGEEFAANANVVEFGMHNDMYPGIGDIATNQLVIYQPMMGAVVCEIALAEVTNAADVDAVKAIFQSRIDMQVNGGAWYPESIKGWQENSKIVTNGNYVMMIAWSYCNEAVDAFNAKF